MRRAGWISITRVAGVCGLSLIAVLAVASSAQAVTCTPPTATFTDDPGNSISASAYYIKKGQFDAGFHIGVSFEGTDGNGDPVSGAGTCGDPNRFTKITLLLGDGDDVGRLDATHPRPPSFGGAVPRSIKAVLKGGSGKDELRGHAGRDIDASGGGKDKIVVNGGGADKANCGAGNDKAIVDVHDAVSHCESVVVR